jgi:hypothetical protein
MLVVARRARKQGDLGSGSSLLGNGRPPSTVSLERAQHRQANNSRLLEHSIERGKKGGLPAIR